MNTKKTLVAVVAALLVAATLPCFAKGNVVTQWKITDGGEGLFITFYSDKTFDVIVTDGYGSSEKIEGTYSGDTTKDGKISLIAANGHESIMETVGDLLDFNGLVLTKVK
ncbi:MAG: hypothetical protein K2N31_03365 [Treponemataceae bacterium]|nr:hypothetical protein [Treponemataceae bacterium]